MYEGNPGEIDFSSNQRQVQVSEGSSNRESTVQVCDSRKERQNSFIVWRLSIRLPLPSASEPTDSPSSNS